MELNRKRWVAPLGDDLGLRMRCFGVEYADQTWVIFEWNQCLNIGLFLSCGRRCLRTHGPGFLLISSLASRLV